jgi:galactose mutarotase-like enzyme
MILDAAGKEIVVGARVVRPYSWNQSGSCALEIRTVDRIKDGKVYLDGSRTCIKSPSDTLAIIG